MAFWRTSLEAARVAKRLTRVTARLIRLALLRVDSRYSGFVDRCRHKSMIFRLCARNDVAEPVLPCRGIQKTWRRTHCERVLSGCCNRAATSAPGEPAPRGATPSARSKSWGAEQILGRAGGGPHDDPSPAVRVPCRLAGLPAGASEIGPREAETLVPSQTATLSVSHCMTPAQAVSRQDSWRRKPVSAQAACNGSRAHAGPPGSGLTLCGGGTLAAGAHRMSGQTRNPRPCRLALHTNGAHL